MRIEVEPADAATIESLRARFRSESHCQIVHDSILPRRLADAFLLTVDSRVAGYGGVWNEYFPNRIVEFYAVEKQREAALFSALVSASGATEIEAQTNMPQMRRLLEAYGMEAEVEKLLFAEGSDSSLVYPGAALRRRRPGEDGPDGEWVVELEGEVVAGGGILTHYNPPYGDLYVEVRAASRGRGLGSFLVQELRRVCREMGLIAAARCDPENVASRRALLRGGMVQCGELRTAQLRMPIPTGQGV